MLRDAREGNPVEVAPSEVGAANAAGGLNLFVCHLGWRGQEYQSEPAANIRAAVVNAFADRCGGNRIRFMVGEVHGERVLDLALRSGCRIFNSYEEWARAQSAYEDPRRPHLVGVSRDEGLRSENFWMAKMFTYFPPVFGFTDAQRSILLLAREGYTDAEIARELGTSAEAVKKRWGGIYERVGHVMPNLLPASPIGGRGAEKRRALLAHLRDRPEELRPCRSGPTPRGANATVGNL